MSNGTCYKKKATFYKELKILWNEKLYLLKKKLENMPTYSEKCTNNVCHV